MKVAFVQDFFEDEIIGGAEKNDSVLLNHLIKKKKKVTPIHSYKLFEKFDEYDFFVVSNFVRMPADIKSAMIDRKNYIIYEHDHKYVANRNPGSFKDFKAPNNMIINRDFYKSAKKVFVLSEVCKKVIQDNLQIENVYNISCSLWSKKDLQLIRDIRHTTGKIHDFGILDSPNAIKGTMQAKEFCKLNNIKPHYISSPDYTEFLTKMSLCKRFIFFPQVLETFSRVCAEAKMLDCGVMTTPKLIGFFSEDYSELSGNKLNDKIATKNIEALVKFEEAIYG